MMGNSKSGSSASKNKEMLKKLKKPEEMGPESELDSLELELSNDSGDESESESDPEMEMPASESPMLSDASDEELMAEFKKRGLSAELESEMPSGDAPESESI
jgi:hypothetical protein